MSDAPVSAKKVFIRTFGRAQHVCHLAGVVFIHLAAEGADEDLLGRNRCVAHGLVQICASGLKRQLAASCGVVGQGLRAISAALRIHTSINWPCRSSV